ncbi:MAG TPA: glycosyltransferase [Thermoanaerobaculia bacterium]|nr:glycosyltransferase [Thermoanaerobaculia bacterium]
MSLSLCIVVKNEASFLAPCIASARPICDEVVVVDTGSTDGTQDVARSAGARVHEESWPGDLGRAHDLPVERASGDWILTLDADEVMDPAGLDEIPRLIDGGEHEGWIFVFRNYLRKPVVRWRWADPRDPLTRGAHGWTPSRTVRLFRNHAAYRNSGLLHHSVAPAILEGGGTLGVARTHVHHYGFLRSDRIKGGAYLRLARRQALSAPQDPQGWLELGIVLRESHDPRRLATAVDAFRRARDLGMVGAGAYFLAAVLVDLGRPAPALDALAEALHAPPADATFFEPADVWETRGQACEALGRIGPAIESYRRALVERPSGPVAINNLAGLLIESGSPDEALELVSGLLRRAPELDMAWATLGRAHAARDDWRSARAALETAVEVGPFNDVAARNLAVVRWRLGDREGARVMWRSARGEGGEGEGDARQPVTPHRVQRLARARPRRPLVVTLARALGGGAGRAMTNVVQALCDDFEHVALLGSRGGIFGFGIDDELEAKGATIELVSSQEQVASRLEALRPAAVIHHLLTPLVTAPRRVADEPWIAAGHSSQPLPLGYDRYVLLSDHHERIQGHVPRELRRRIPNCVDRARFDPSRRVVSGEPLVAMVSRLEPGKFPRRLLDHLPDLERLGARVAIAGAGVRRLQIAPEAEARGLGERVRFLGPVPHRELPELLARAEIGLHLTETESEIHSIAVLEMMSAGLPIVSQPRGCLPELVADGDNGLLAAGEDEARAALERLILDPELRLRMGRAGRVRAAAFDRARFEESWRALLDEAVAGVRWEEVGASTRDAGLGGEAPPPGWPAARTLILCGGGDEETGRLAESLGESGLVAPPVRLLEPRRRRALAGALGACGLVDYLQATMEEWTPPSGVFALRIELPDLAGLDPAGGGSAVAGARRLAELVPDPVWCLVAAGADAGAEWGEVIAARGVRRLATAAAEAAGAERAATVLDSLGLVAAM